MRTAGRDLIVGCLPEPFVHDDGAIAAGRVFRLNRSVAR
jgi:hypothetical protein